MEQKDKYPEDDFSLEEFRETFAENLKYHYYERNKHKFNILFYLIMTVSVALAFLIYLVIVNIIGFV